jgi:hypothetical protein
MGPRKPEKKEIKKGGKRAEEQKEAAAWVLFLRVFEGF